MDTFGIGAAFAKLRSYARELERITEREARECTLPPLKDYSESKELWRIQDELLNQENPDIEELERITEMIRNPPLQPTMGGALWHLLQITEYRDI
jgi:hypothetical protein